MKPGQRVRPIREEPYSLASTFQSVLNCPNNCALSHSLSFRYLHLLPTSSVGPTPPLSLCPRRPLRADSH